MMHTIVTVISVFRGRCSEEGFLGGRDDGDAGWIDLQRCQADLEVLGPPGQREREHSSRPADDLSIGDHLQHEPGQEVFHGCSEQPDEPEHEEKTEPHRCAPSMASYFIYLTFRLPRGGSYDPPLQFFAHIFFSWW